MPELPEVETMVRDLSTRVLGLTVRDATAPFEGSVIWPAYPEFASRVRGRSISSVSRRGKYAIFELDSGDLLIIHRGMTGTLLHRPSTTPLEPHVRIVFHLDDDSELRFRDPRKFGKVYLLAASGCERALPWVAMGPEPLNGHFTSRGLHESLAKRTAPIKPLLLNQRIVAGLGNIYVDEALHRARLHPLRSARSLTTNETRRLHRGIRVVLNEAIENRGTTFDSYVDLDGRPGSHLQSLRVFNRTGRPCCVCATPVVKLTVQGRGTHICPRCQQV